MNPSDGDPLNQLRIRYEQLVGDVQEGAISYDQALSTLASLTVVDGQGATWSINADGEYLRGEAGQQPQPADPRHFAPIQLPARETANNPPWSNPDLMTPPGQPHGSQPVGGQPQSPTSPSMLGTQPWSPPAAQVGNVRHLDDDKPSLKDRIVGGLTNLPGIGNIVSDRRLLIIAAVAFGLVIAATAWARINTDPLEDAGIPTTAPTAPADPAAPGAPTAVPTATTDPAMPVDPDAAASTLPTPDDVQRVMSALTSADRTVAASVLVSAGDNATVALQTATYAGIPPSQLALAPHAPAALTDEGKVVQQWRITDAVDNTTYAILSIEWVSTDGGWKLATWPRRGE